MIVVIQCAASKRPGAGCLQTRDGRHVLFVADPASAPPSPAYVYARPDDMSDHGVTWRELLRRYNQAPGVNRLGLHRAIDLYANPAYGQLAAGFGAQKIYVLSAGWGLIRADFLTPNYDITFSAAAEPYKRRSKRDRYDDERMLADITTEAIVFFGGKDYVPLFCRLTEAVKGPRTIFYNSRTPPQAPRCSLIPFATSTRTNWHYECVSAFLRGELAQPAPESR